MSPIDLCPARYAGSDVVSFSLFRGKKGKVLNEQRPGSDEGHIPFQDIPELGKFVEGGSPKEVAEGKPSLIRWKPVVFGEGAEFEERKNLFIPPDPGLNE